MQHITDADYKNTYVGRMIEIEIERCRREGIIDPLDEAPLRTDDVWRLVE